VEFELTTLVVIGTDCIGISNKNEQTEKQTLMKERKGKTKQD
jgi:hypothetical protein